MVCRSGGNCETMPSNSFYKVNHVIDSDGFRPNVGIILANRRGQVLWARRIGQGAWQFPQGGIDDDESPEDALYRELYEEIGLEREDVRILACTRGWLRYRLPRRLVRQDSVPLCVGQKQKWFLLELLGSDEKVCMNRSGSPEFDGWRWVSYWYPAESGGHIQARGVSAGHEGTGTMHDEPAYAGACPITQGECCLLRIRHLQD